MLFELNFKQKFATTIGMSFALIFLSLIVGNNIYLQGLLLLLTMYLFTGDRISLVFSFFMAMPRDLKAIQRFVWLNLILFRWQCENMTVCRVFESVMSRHPHKTAFLMDDEKMTFLDVEQFTNRIAAYFRSQGFKHGDTIALVMENRPEYGCIWLGLSKIGVITALVNSQLRKDVLLHSIKVANSKGVIVGSELAEAYKEIENVDGALKIPVYQFHDKKQFHAKIPLIEGAISLNYKLEEQSAEPMIDILLSGNVKDKLLYIYTSGTTGLPKAAVITNMRYMFIVMGCSMMLGLRKDDIIYNSLPLYHMAGGMIGIGNVFLRGATMAMRKRFSASNYWLDCIKYKCTVGQYIGEICRYLLAAPPTPHENQHKLRLMFGNGLRPQIWQQFITRFNIPNVGEVYGSTEGNSNLANIDSTVGAVGFVPRTCAMFYPVTLIKCNESTGEPIRKRNGRCIQCKPGEPGIFIGKIIPKLAANSFSGYADKKETEKKILCDVFRKGDHYFNSGDILVMDILGNFYFKDRTGDTFRWRGENVATAEVEAVISNIIGLNDCAAYGVEIPNIEGKAGMVAIVDENRNIDIENLSIGIRGSLPPYARPLFIRLINKLSMTATFKMKKIELQNEGYDLKRQNDPIYFLNADGVYREFTEKDYDDLINGKIRL